MLRKQRGQGLTEFAFVLPVLLLLLLGIIEASRVIWAYITVQTAAREAVRYAVAGRPYLDTNQSIDLSSYTTPAAQICQGDSEEPAQVGPGVQPWLCNVDMRADAIKEVAMRRGRTLAIAEEECTAPDQFISGSSTCWQQPGAFGVLIRGQVVSGTEVIEQIDHPGTQGLNVEVWTFYNVKMITPIFDFIMGGEYLTLQGRVQMQNEGLDAAIGINPPPPIAPPDPGDSVGPDGGDTTGREIWSVSGYTNIEQTQILIVHLQNHAQSSGPYDIYLENSAGVKYPICTGVTTDGTGKTNPDAQCDLGLAGVLPGAYDLYSTASGTTGPRLALAPDEVQVIAGGNPRIIVDGGTIWAANSTTKVKLLSHEASEEPYRVAVYDNSGTTLIQTIIPSVGASAGLSGIDWTVPDVEYLVGASLKCDITSKKPCKIKSFDKNDAEYAVTDVYINQPEIVVAPEQVSYAQGTTLRFFVKGHTPHKRYDIVIHGGPTDPFLIGTTLDTDANGDSVYPLAWAIPASCNVSGWPNGFYDVTSQPNTETDQIAIYEDLQIDTPPDPYLNIDGGTTWPAGSFINIELHNHEDLANHYLEFDSGRVPINSSAGDTFDTNECGHAVIGYTIPLAKPTGTYNVASFLTDAITNPQAEIDVQVTDIPFIEVLDGDTVLPDQEITIRLGNHAPNTSYKIVYAGQELKTVLTEGDGGKETTYDMKNFPLAPGPDFSYGVFYDMYSQDLSFDRHVATTTMAIQSADLQVVQVEFPPDVAMNTTVPMTVTVRNTQPVPITRYFDIDFYLNPSPVAPSYLSGYNFPGDIKHWQNSVAAAGQPGDTFTIVDDVFIDEAGAQTVYGYADTSNFIFEGEQAGQAANPNNLSSDDSFAQCEANPPVTYNFNNSTQLNDWSETEFNNSHGSASISSNRLRLNHTNGSTFESSDRHYIYYLTNPVSSTLGLDIAVKVIQAPNDRQYAKAGISIRNSLDANSPKIDFALSAHSNGSAIHHLQAAYRTPGNDTSRIDDVSNVDAETQVRLGDGPIWLRLVRVPNSNTIEYYWAQQSTMPADDQWTFYGDTDLVALNDPVYIGLFGSNYRNNNDDINNYSDSIFDDFSYTTYNCPTIPDSSDDIPPGLTVCTEPLSDQSFEQSLSDWQIAFSQGVQRSPGQAHSGNFKLMAASFNGSFFNPWFYQPFMMSDWVISSTTSFELELYKNIDSLTDGNDSNDQFYAVVTTDPSNIANAIASKITTPTVVAQGVMDGPYDPTKWDPVQVSLPIIDPDVIESYAGQELYLYFYNNGNSQGTCSGSGCTTKFYFDDINLSPCTTQPLPDSVSTRIRGELTLHFSDGTSEKLPYVKVWAYAKNDDTVYETFSIQNGEFNFYNLPAAAPPGGTEYLIFAQYYLVDAFDPSQIETLAADASIILTSNNGNANPAQTFLDMYTLAPQP